MTPNYLLFPTKSRIKSFHQMRTPLPSPIKSIALRARWYHPARNTNFCLIQSEHQKQGESPEHSLSSSQDPETTEEVSLPDLAVGGRCLCDDRAGLGWRHGLLNHNAGVMVGHPGAAKLVSSGPRHGPTNCVMHRDILPREDRGEGQKKSSFILLSSSQRTKLGI